MNDTPVNEMPKTWKYVKEQIENKGKQTEPIKPIMLKDLFDLIQMHKSTAKDDELQKIQVFENKMATNHLKLPDRIRAFKQQRIILKNLLTVMAFEQIKADLLKEAQRQSIADVSGRESFEFTPIVAVPIDNPPQTQETAIEGNL